MKKTISALLVLSLLMLAVVAFPSPIRAASAHVAIVKTSPPIVAEAASKDSAVALTLKRQTCTHVIGVMMTTNEQEVSEVTTRARTGPITLRGWGDLREPGGAYKNTTYTLRC